MILSTQLISVVEANLWYPRIPAPVLMGLWITMALQRRKENMVFTFLILAAKIRSENNPNIVYLQPDVLHSTICSCMVLKNILERTFWVRSNFPEVVYRPSGLWDTPFNYLSRIAKIANCIPTHDKWLTDKWELVYLRWSPIKFTPNCGSLSFKDPNFRLEGPPERGLWYPLSSVR